MSIFDRLNPQTPKPEASQDSSEAKPEIEVTPKHESLVARLGGEAVENVLEPSSSDRAETFVIPAYAAEPKREDERTTEVNMPAFDISRMGTGTTSSAPLESKPTSDGFSFGDRLDTRVKKANSFEEEVVAEHEHTIRSSVEGALSATEQHLKQLESGTREAYGAVHDSLKRSFESEKQWAELVDESLTALQRKLEIQDVQGDDVKKIIDKTADDIKVTIEEQQREDREEGRERSVASTAKQLIEELELVSDHVESLDMYKETADVSLKVKSALSALEEYASGRSIDRAELLREHINPAMQALQVGMESRQAKIATLKAILEQFTLPEADMALFEK